MPSGRGWHSVITTTSSSRAIRRGIARARARGMARKIGTTFSCSDDRRAKAAAEQQCAIAKAVKAKVEVEVGIWVGRKVRAGPGLFESVLLRSLLESVLASLWSH